MYVYVLFADGFEEIEAVTPVDVLRRAGFDVITVSIYGDRKTVTGAHGIPVIADETIGNVKVSEALCIVLPGGGTGVMNLNASGKVREIVKEQYSGGRFVAAICAAPTILSGLGILKGKCATCYPSMRSELDAAERDGRSLCIRDGCVITSVGPGTAGEFAFALCEILGKPEKASALRTGMCCPEKTEQSLRIIG